MLSRNESLFLVLLCLCPLVIVFSLLQKGYYFSLFLLFFFLSAVSLGSILYVLLLFLTFYFNVWVFLLLVFYFLVSKTPYVFFFLYYLLLSNFYFFSYTIPYYSTSKHFIFFQVFFLFFSLFPFLSHSYGLNFLHFQHSLSFFPFSFALNEARVYFLWTSYLKVNCILVKTLYWCLRV